MIRGCPAPLRLSEAYFYMQCSAHGSRDNEKVFKHKRCSFLHQHQFQKQLFLDVILSSTHPVHYAGLLFFYPDFLPSSHSSALPSVPLHLMLMLLLVSVHIGYTIYHSWEASHLLRL